MVIDSLAAREASVPPTSGQSMCAEPHGVAEYLLATGDDSAVALVTGGKRVTYGALRHAVASFARRLAEIGLAKGTPVALLAANGVFWASAYLAILRRGLVVVPLPTGQTPAEYAARIALVQAPAVFVGSAQAPMLSAVDRANVEVIVDGDIDVSGASGGEHAIEVAPSEDAAYLFTSGTTGTPRIVRLTHANIRANTESILAYTHLRSADRALVVLPYSYVFGASLLHTHLRAGAALVDQPSTAFPETTVNMLADEACTVFAGVPSVFHALLRNSSFSRRALPHLRMIQQAGGRLPVALLRELAAAQPQARVHVMYGQTEATARLSALDPALLFDKLGSIGRGIPGVALRVTDDAGQDVAPGVVGEIRARGANISPGYLGEPERSAQKMPNGELRTGDLATIDNDGFLYIVDRVEDFIKTSGFRVASQDVEAAAMEMADLMAVAAVGVPDDVLGERIEVLAVPRPDAVVTPDEVVRHCRALLPRHAAPSAVQFCEELPLNANGKVVKRVVRQMLIDGRHSKAPDVEHA